MDKNVTEEVKSDLDPILAVFAAEDGGAAFARLRHGFLVELYANQNKTEKEQELVTVVKRFSKLCEIFLRKNG